MAIHWRKPCFHAFPSSMPSSLLLLQLCKELWNTVPASLHPVHNNQQQWQWPRWQQWCRSPMSILLPYAARSNAVMLTGKWSFWLLPQLCMEPWCSAQASPHHAHNNQQSQWWWWWWWHNNPCWWWHHSSPYVSHPPHQMYLIICRITHSNRQT